MKLSYYPGCTLHSTGAEYGESVAAVFGALGIEAAELEDWNCCGASSAHSTDHQLAVLLAGRNLAIAQGAGQDLVVPCAACYSRLKQAQHELTESAALQARLGEATGIPWAGGAAVRSAVEVIDGGVPAGEIAARVKRPLAGLKVVPYYGCLLTRPRAITGAANPDHPESLDRILGLLGATVVEWSYKTDCCGAGLALSRTEQVVRLVGKLVERAVEAGADCIAAACPMCQANLEMRQPGAGKMPVLYFTELMGLAFGLPEAGKWWGRHIVDPRPLLARVLGSAGRLDGSDGVAGR